MNRDFTTRYEDWSSRMTQAFGEPVGGTEIAAVTASESAYARWAYAEFESHAHLVEAFHGFFAKTIRQSMNQTQTTPERQHYSYFLGGCIANFRLSRAAESLFFGGYPLIGYALLRDLKDQAFMIAAVGHGVTGIVQVKGFTEMAEKGEPFTSADLQRAQVLRRREEQRIMDRLLWSRESGLTKRTHRKRLKDWNDKFNSEVHGSWFSQAQILSDWRQGSYPHLANQQELSAAMYRCRAREVNWMHLRVLPLLQTTEKSHGADWTAQWQLLDDGFRLFVEHQAAQGKDIADTIMHLIDEKFNFHPERACYRE